MDSLGPMLLPKGILTNSSTVYDEVAGYSTLPADKVRQYWHVYTTTNKKLKDPTAHRLENFWWHVWGSDRSKLSGRVLARIFQDISHGPTVVPLRGPPNRWEGPDVPPLTTEMIVAHLQRNFPVKPGNVGASTTKHRGTSARGSSATTLRSFQLPPILKKVGSSSSNVAKHTARFIMPHESPEEDGVESDTPSSGSTLANGFGPSGHTIASNDPDVRGNASSLEPQSSTTSLELMSKPSSAEKQPTRKEPSSMPAQHLRSGGQPSTEVNDAGRFQTSMKRPFTDSVAQKDHKASPELAPHEKLARGKQPMMRQSQSNTMPDRPRELSMTKPKRSLFTQATSSTTNVAAQGTIIDQAGSTQHLPRISTSSLAQDDHISAHGGTSAYSSQETRLTPTRPSSSAVLPLGRTKSQLTLLLEREKERSRS
ncbi:hypothetical protein LLEC1_03587 [Akanthomyces lecanii]|uniref:Uncharacterized protein n=1 Tax=Cordyceps confragosa TaxID=2714763 RepID=A0A179I959_CORDF|nr:hypothetical protein LLEC1_03587 [Akanthomyces lecanii]